MKRFAAFLLGLMLVPICFAYQVPQIGHSGYDGFSLTQEQEFGVQFIHAVRDQLPLIGSPSITHYVQQLGALLVKHSNAPKRHFYFFVVNDNSINAFAGPDGYIGINSGLILAAHSEAELASVMAHEIAHVTQRHLARTYASMKRAQFANIAAMLAAAVIGGQGGQGLAAGAAAGSNQSFINHTRAHEKEADRAGIKNLAKAGFDPSNMAGFFKRLHDHTKLNRGTSSLPEMLSTHPLTENRLAEAETLAKRTRVQNRRRLSQEFYFVQANILANGSRDPRALAQRLKNKKGIAEQYAYAICLLKLGKQQQALRLLKVINQQARQGIVSITYSNALQGSGNTQAALNILNNSLRQHPGDLALIINKANVLLHAGRAKQAVKVLKPFDDKFAEQEVYLSLLSKALGKAGNLSKAYQTRAQLLVLLHLPKAALTQLEQAKKFAKGDAIQSARIEHEIKMLKRNFDLTT